MAKKSIAANAEKMAANDAKPTTEGAVKYVSGYPNFGFMVYVKDEKGEQVFHTDANGNARLPTTKEYHFARVNVKDAKTGKFDQNLAYSIFIADPAVQKGDFDAIVKRLEELRKNPINKMHNDEDWFKQRNPEAFRIAKEKSEIEAVLSAKDARIEELERKLGFKKA
jgi:hypothetical protein